jgi:hypothetical protein
MPEIKELLTCRVCGGGIWWQDCPAGGWWVHRKHPDDGHDAGPEIAVLAAIICCPACRTELEAVWAEPGDSDESPEPALQTCGSCADSWVAEYPGFSFRTEAG